MIPTTSTQMKQIQTTNAQTIVFKSSFETGTVPFENQAEFENCVWSNFGKHDILWLECDEAKTCAGIFLGFKDGNETQPIIKLTSEQDGAELNNLNVNSISDLEGFKWVMYKQ